MVARTWIVAVALTLGCGGADVAPAGVTEQPAVALLSGASLDFDAQLAVERQTLVVFMTAWCEVCHREQPALETWARAHRADSRVLLVISGSPLPAARALVAERRVDADALTVVVDAEGVLADRLNVEATPTLMVYGPGGALTGTYHRLADVPRPRTSFLQRVHDGGSELGTSYDVVVLTSKDRVDAARADLVAARKRCQELGRLLSEWRDDSEISRVNAAAGAAVVPIGPELRQILSGAQYVAEQTHGAFDVTWRPLGRAWDAAGERGEPLAGDALASAREPVGYRRLQVGDDGVRFGHPRMELGIAGVAKGWIIDAVFHQLRKAGHEHILVNIGGDLRTSGRDPHGAPRTLKLVNPYVADGRVAAEIETADVAVATSGNYLRGRDVTGTLRVGHIVDPRTGLAPAFDGSVTVLARDAALADALATALFVMGPDAGLQFVEKAAGVEAIYVTRTGARASSGVRVTP